MSEIIAVITRIYKKRKKWHFSYMPIHRFRALFAQKPRLEVGERGYLFLKRDLLTLWTHANQDTDPGVTMQKSFKYQKGKGPGLSAPHTDATNW